MFCPHDLKCWDLRGKIWFQYGRGNKYIVTEKGQTRAFTWVLNLCLYDYNNCVMCILFFFITTSHDHEGKHRTYWLIWKTAMPSTSVTRDHNTMHMDYAFFSVECTGIELDEIWLNLLFNRNKKFIWVGLVCIFFSIKSMNKKT